MGCGASATPDKNAANDVKEATSQPAVPKGVPKDVPTAAPQSQSTDAPKAAAGYPAAPSEATQPAAAAEAKPEVPAEPELPPPKPCLHAYGFAGRAELTRLIAAVGGLEIEERTELQDTVNFGSPGSLPCLEHGSLKIAQSFAIESYVASVAPGFKDLSPQQRATDAMFCKIKEDLIAVYIANVSTLIADDSEKAAAAENIAELGDKWFPVIEGMLSMTGFINGQSFPTAADLAVLNMARGFMPFGAAYMMGSYDVLSKFPKFAAHAERVAAYPAVQAFLDRSKTMDADPMDLRAGEAGSKGVVDAISPEAKEEAGPAAPQAKEGTVSTDLDAKAEGAAEAPEVKQ